MKKKIIKIGLILLALLLLHQLYWYVGQSGNLVLFVSNKSDIELAEIEVTLDGKRIVEDSFSTGIYNYKNYSFNVSPWKHDIEVVCNHLGIKEKFSFYNFFVTRVLIDLTENDVENTESSQLFYIRSEYVYGKLILE